MDELLDMLEVVKEQARNMGSDESCALACMLACVMGAIVAGESHYVPLIEILHEFSQKALVKLQNEKSAREN